MHHASHAVDPPAAASPEIPSPEIPTVARVTTASDQAFGTSVADHASEHEAAEPVATHEHGMADPETVIRATRAEIAQLKRQQAQASRGLGRWKHASHEQRAEEVQRLEVKIESAIQRALDQFTVSAHRAQTPDVVPHTAEATSTSHPSTATPEATPIPDATMHAPSVAPEATTPATSHAIASPSADASGAEIAATDAAMGQHLVHNMNRANVAPGAGGINNLNFGIHYWYNFKAKCETAGKPELWKEEYHYGHTQAPQFIQPYEQNKFMDFELKKGQSASDGIRAWLVGATIAECRSAVVAMEIDALRAAIGNHKFDKMFGSADSAEDEKIPEGQRMHVAADAGVTPVANYMVRTKLAEKASAGGPFGTVDPAELDKDSSQASGTTSTITPSIC